MQFVDLTTQFHDLFFSQDFKEAIAKYPDLSDVRYNQHHSIVNNILVTCSSHPICFLVSICRLKDLELLLQDVVSMK